MRRTQQLALLPIAADTSQLSLMLSAAALLSLPLLFCVWCFVISCTSHCGRCAAKGVEIHSSRVLLHRRCKPSRRHLLHGACALVRVCVCVRQRERERERERDSRHTHTERTLTHKDTDRETKTQTRSHLLRLLVTGASSILSWRM